MILLFTLSHLAILVILIYSMIPITTETLQEIKSSRQAAEHIFKILKIKGWPKIITTEPGKHFLAS